MLACTVYQTSTGGGSSDARQMVRLGLSNCPPVIRAEDLREPAWIDRLIRL